MGPEATPPSGSGNIVRTALRFVLRVKSCVDEVTDIADVFHVIVIHVIVNVYQNVGVQTLTGEEFSGRECRQAGEFLVPLHLGDEC